MGQELGSVPGGCGVVWEVTQILYLEALSTKYHHGHPHPTIEMFEAPKQNQPEQTRNKNWV